MNQSDCIRTLCECWYDNVPVFVRGGPGVGKTHFPAAAVQVLRAETADESIALWLMTAGTADSCDMRGVPGVQGDLTAWYPPATLPQGDARGFLVFDDFPQARTEVQHACTGWFGPTRATDNYALPKRVLPIILGNGPEHRSDALPLPAHFQGRVMVIDVNPEWAPWDKWAIREGINPDFRGFLHYSQRHLYTFDPEKIAEGEPYGSPRTIHLADKPYKRVAGNGGFFHDARGREKLEGLLGVSWVADFAMYLNLAENAIDPEQVIAEPDGAPVPEPGAPALYALISVLQDRAELANIDSIVRYAYRLNEEMGEVLVQGIMVKDKAFTTTGALVEWVKDHPELHNS